MKNLIGFTIFVLTMACCSQKPVNEFPSELKTSKTDKHTRVKGTKVFGIIPPDYKIIEEMIRYQKNDNLYIQIIESVGSSFTDSKSKFTREAIEAQGAKVDILSNIKLNEYDAIYGEGPSKHPDELKLMLSFGDETFVVMVLGVCKTADTEGKKELQEIMKSVYYDKSLQTDPMELANFEFDLSITGFKYATRASNLFMYTQNGKNDANNSTANGIQIQTLPKVTDEKAESFSNDLLWRYEKSGLSLDNKKIVKTVVNGYTAFVLQSKIKYENKDGIMYQAFLIGNKSSLIFVGNAYTDRDNYLDKFKRTAETIVIK